MGFTSCCGCDNCAMDLHTQVYQIHFTVANSDGFLEFCANNGIKAIRVDNLNEVQYMTSQVVKGTFHNMLDEYYRLEDILEPFNIVRKKIETNRYFAGIQYYEAHISFNYSIETIEHLASVWSDLYVSKVNNKTIVTIRKNRDETNLYNFESYLKTIVIYFLGLGYIPIKTIIEYCWYDDNLNLDAEWKPAKLKNKLYA